MLDFLSIYIPPINVRQKAYLRSFYLINEGINVTV